MERDGGRFAAGEPMPVGVDAASIEADLRALWEDASRSGVVARFVQFSLIALLESEERIPAATAVLAELAASHPARLILIAPSRDPSRPPSAWVSAHCHLAESETRHICCEQIAIVAGERAMGEVPELADRLLLADLPVVIWSPAPIGGGASLLDPLARLSRQILVDSSSARALDAQLRAVARFAAAHRSQAVPADLAWLRGGNWRETTAQLFDPPSMRPLLERIEGVRIRAAGSRLSAQALYHIAWLASRLRWDPVAARRAGGAPAIAFDAAGRRILCAIEPAEGVAGSEEGDIAALELAIETDGEAQLLRAVLAQDESSIELSAEPPLASLPPRAVEWERPRLASLIHREIEFPRRDPLFEEVLPKAESVAAAIAGAAPSDDRD